MIKNRLLGVGLIFLIIAFIFIQPAYVGPGSKIAKAVLGSFWGLLFFIGVAITCLPMGIYEFVCSKLEKQRSLQDLR